MAETLFEESRRYILGKMRGILREGGRKLPTDRELAGEMFASYATIRLVMGELEREGFIRRIRGSGTYLEPGAAELLERAFLPVVRLFTSPVNGTADNDYAAYLVDELTRQAAGKRFRIEHRQVATHNAFLAELDKEADSRVPVVYLPPTAPFTMQQLGRLGRFDHIPLVVIDCELGNINVNNITTDNRKGGMLAARTLLAGGCRKLALLLCEPPLRQISQRVQGFTEIAELSGAEVEIWDCQVRGDDERTALAHRKTLAALRAGHRPDGIFAVSDSGAVSAAEAIRPSGFELGRDIALIGFDGLPATRTHKPSLGSIAQPVAEIGEEVFSLLGTWQQGTHVQKLLSPRFQSGASVMKKEKATTAIPT